MTNKAFLPACEERVSKSSAIPPRQLSEVSPPAPTPHCIFHAVFRSAVLSPTSPPTPFVNGKAISVPWGGGERKPQKSERIIRVL